MKASWEGGPDYGAIWTWGVIVFATLLLPTVLALDIFAPCRWLTWMPITSVPTRCLRGVGEP